MKQRVLGIVAHVDSGKTTLSESMLFEAGTIRKLGRVDRKDAFLDTEELERERGITIFSKQAVFTWQDRRITLLDTPGHVDFSSEMERTLSVLDAAVLVISGTDGVQSHTRTLWKLLERYQLPTFLFINKMDLAGANQQKVLDELSRELSYGCQDFTSDVGSDEWSESLAMCDEALLNSFLEGGCLSDAAITAAISERKVFPCYFGSALKDEGVRELLDGMERYLPQPVTAGRSTEPFSARVFKISRDDDGKRLTWIKLQSGRLRVREAIDTGKEEPEKISQIRIYSGTKYESVPEAEAGTVCAVVGPEQTFAGQGLGALEKQILPVLEPVMTYQVMVPFDCDPFVLLGQLRQLEEEDPMLHVLWNEQLGEIHMQLMGEVQTEVLKHVIWQRFHVEVAFAEGHILYKETIAEPVEGVGHFEPLRHYAEVHLLLEPGERGSGIEIFTDCREDVLDKNWQRLICTHILEQEHPGVLTGSPLTDVRITLLTGRAHLKHTEGGDFRQATYRAIRQGLKKGKSLLLEPWYAYRLDVPTELIGRAMSDIQRMQGEFDSPVTLEDGRMTRIAGRAPVSRMQGYMSEVHAYSRGEGRLFLELSGYEPVPQGNVPQILDEIGYDSEHDLEHPTGSVFCAHGAGFVVPWYEVENYMHLPCREEDADTSAPGWEDEEQALAQTRIESGRANQTGNRKNISSYADDKELEAIFNRTFGEVKRRTGAADSNLGYEKTKSYASKVKRPDSDSYPPKRAKTKEEYLIVDGYNIIFAWDELKAIAADNLDGARDRLNEILCNYQGYRRCHLTVVYDAYKRKQNAGSEQDYHNIHVVFTKEGQTADMYIEEFAHSMGREKQLTVATSDQLEQLTVSSQGALRMSARELHAEIEKVNQVIREEYLNKEFPKGNRIYPFAELALNAEAFLKQPTGEQ